MPNYPLTVSSTNPPTTSQDIPENISTIVPTSISKNLLGDSFEHSFKNATGKIDYGLTNDYMFRIILQRNPNILESLICSLLHLKHEDVRSITIQNPITSGIGFNLKDFIMDIKILFNDNTIINLEMQVRKQLYWSEYPEFYSTYQLLNVKNHHLYSDKFTLSVVNLTQIEKATDEDKAFNIDYWAKIFKATTWEEIKMLAEKDKVFQDAAQALYKMNFNAVERERCEAIEDYELRMAKRQLRMEQLETELAKSKTALAENQIALAEKDSIIAALQAELAKLQK